MSDDPRPDAPPQEHPPTVAGWKPGEGSDPIRDAATVEAGEAALDEGKLAALPRNDWGNGQRLLNRFPHDLIVLGGERYTWLAWDGKRYGRDGGLADAQKVAFATARAIGEKETKAIREGEPLGPKPGGALDGDAVKDWTAKKQRIEARVGAHQRWGLASGNMGKVNGMLMAAAPQLRRPIADLDADPFALNLPNGTLDLGAVDGEGRPLLSPRKHAYVDRITHLAGADFADGAVCPYWDAFLRQVLPDDGVRQFFQRIAGYCLTGSIDEQAIFIFYGTGANGKSIATRVLSKLLGDYAVTLPIQTFLQQDHKRAADATPDLARLPGVRLVTASEPQAGDRFSEQAIKTMTGGEAIPIRPLFKEMFEIDPVFKIMLSMNLRPRVQGTDHGVWRRLLMMPWSFTVPEGQRVLPTVLMQRFLAEMPGILGWAIDGFLSWRERGLDPPAAVREATEDYRRESDPVGEYMRDCTQKQDGRNVQASRLYQNYVAWAKASALEPVSSTRFGNRLRELKYTKYTAGSVFYVGLAITRDMTKHHDEPLEGLEGSDGEGHD